MTFEVRDLMMDVLPAQGPRAPIAGETDLAGHGVRHWACELASQAPPRPKPKPGPKPKPKPECGPVTGWGGAEEKSYELADLEILRGQLLASLESVPAVEADEVEREWGAESGRERRAPQTAVGGDQSWAVGAMRPQPRRLARSPDGSPTKDANL